jgi:hypothetical protein
VLSPDSYSCSPTPPSGGRSTLLISTEGMLQQQQAASHTHAEVRPAAGVSPGTAGRQVWYAGMHAKRQALAYQLRNSLHIVPKSRAQHTWQKMVREGRSASSHATTWWKKAQYAQLT